MAVCWAALGAPAALAEPPLPAADPPTRQLWDEAFARSRPPSAHDDKPGTPGPRAGSADPTFVGVTVWRVRSAAGESWLAERSAVGTPFEEGKPVRLTLEASRTGYLYVIDCEQYADGSLGAPYLIFPTLRLHRGDNAVQAGRVVEIPDQADQPPFLVMKKSRRDHVSEQLFMLITPAPLVGFTIGRDAQPVTRAQLQQLLKSSRPPTRALELAGGVGRPYTSAEREAAADPARRLTGADPLPQTLYHVEAGPDEPVLVRVPLPFAGASPP